MAFTHQALIPDTRRATLSVYRQTLRRRLLILGVLALATGVSLALDLVVGPSNLRVADLYVDGGASLKA